MSAKSYNDVAVHCVRINQAMCCHKALKKHGISTDDMLQKISTPLKAIRRRLPSTLLPPQYELADEELWPTLCDPSTIPWPQISLTYLKRAPACSSR